MTKNHPYKKYSSKIGIHGITLLYLRIVCVFVLTNCSGYPKNAHETKSDAKIFPEYYHLTIPPNMAPLNFIIKEPGTKFRVEISTDKSKTIAIQQSSPAIQIPLGAWKKILIENAGKTLKIDIWACNYNSWNKYNSIQHNISVDPIDPYLVYRKIHTVYLLWHDMGIYQRNVTNFDESPLIENFSIDYGCMNCHSFSKKDPSRMLIHFRLVHSGTLFWNEGKLFKVNTRTPNTLSAGVQPAWHPNGKLVAFSTEIIQPHLTTRKDKVLDVADIASDIIVYNIKTNTVITSPNVSTKRRENMPLWSVDGKYLYFISAPEVKEGDDESMLHSKYDLMRIAYDADLNVWGEPEMVLSSAVTGLSISMPSVSPDGKYIVCSMSDYGYFTIFHKKSDLYLIDLKTKKYKKLELNSNSTESYSTWSSNSRWLVFSSKRIDDVFTRPFISYIDSNGVAYTPFVLPQKDPEMYYRLLANYNRPELITGKVELTPIEIRNAILQNAQEVFMEK
jgi:hypothetical protein